MDIEKGKTIKYIKEKRQVSDETKSNLKEFTKIKKSILTALKESDKTIPELVEIIKLPGHEVLFYLMTLQKYGLVATGEIDDMDEYFYYKIKE